MADSWAHQSFNVSAPLAFWMPRAAAARAMALLTTPLATLSNTCVPADEQSRLGEQVVHGVDVLTAKKLPQIRSS